MSDIQPPKTVLCIPGNWADRRDLEERIEKLSGGYILSGDLLKCTKNDDSFDLEICGPDERMEKAFRVSAPHWKETIEMARIRDHRMVLYVLGEGGSSDKARAFLKAGAALMYSGGLGVKIESAGLAHRPVDWIRFAEESLMLEHRVYVVYVTGSETFSCGMHNLGLRDAIVKADQAADAVALLTIFNQYQYIETPDTRPGNTFSTEEGAPRYRISYEQESPYGTESLFHNPYGMWRLALV